MPIVRRTRRLCRPITRLQVANPPFVTRDERRPRTRRRPRALHGGARRLDECAYVVSRRELGDEAFNLALAPLASPGEHVAVVFAGEIWREQQDAGQVYRGVREHLEQDRELCATRAARQRRWASSSEPKLENAVRREGTARPVSVGAAGVDLGEVGEDESVEAIRATDVAL
jgi:hypothetical protein